MVVIRRKDGMDREAFLEHWTAAHPAYVAKLPGIRGYRQNIAIDHRKQWPWDGIAELMFDSVKDVAIAFDSPAAAALFKHEEDFLASTEWFIADEHDVDLIVPED